MRAICTHNRLKLLIHSEAQSPGQTGISAKHGQIYVYENKKDETLSPVTDEGERQRETNRHRIIGLDEMRVHLARISAYRLEGEKGLLRALIRFAQD